MKNHNHHVVPRHLGGTDDDWNLEEIDFITHAELHANRYVQGLDRQFDYRHEGWRYLSSELRAAVRAEHSRRFKTEENPMKNPETAEKVAAQRRGKPGVPGRFWSEESKEKFRGPNNPDYQGKNQAPMTPEMKKAHSERMKNNNPMKDPKVAKKVSEAKKGKPGSRKGVTLTEETKDKLRKSLTGKKASVESKAKMSASRTGKKRGPYKKWSEEDKKAQSERMKLVQKRRKENG